MVVIENHLFRAVVGVVGAEVIDQLSELALILHIKSPQNIEAAKVFSRLTTYEPVDVVVIVESHTDGGFVVDVAV